jgi:hypothetical protein
MRIVASLLVLVVCLSPLPASAQNANASSQKHTAIRSANRKILAGAVIAAAGALVLPLTSPSSKEAQQPGRVVAAFGLIGLGGGIALAGVSQRHKAVRPETSIQFLVGNSASLRISRTW